MNGGGLELIVASIVANVGNLVFHIVMSRMLGPSNYGALGSLLGLVTIVSLAVAATQAAVIQAVAQRRGPNSGTHDDLNLLTPIAGTGVAAVVAALGIVAAAAPVTSFLHISSRAPAILFSAFIAITILTLVPQGVLLGRLSFRAVAAALIAGAAVRLAAGVALVGAGGGLNGAVVATILGGAATLLLLVWPLRREIALSKKGHPLHIGFAAAMLATVALVGVSSLVGVDSFLARHFLSRAASGYYVAAATAGRIALFLPGAIALVAFPKFAAARGDAAESRRLLAHALGAVGILSGVTAVVTLAARHLVIAVLFGQRYEAASSIVGILAVSAAAIGLITVLVYFQLARESKTAVASWLGVGAATALITVAHSGLGAIAWVMVAVTVAVLVLLLGAAFVSTSKRGQLAGAVTVDPDAELDPAVAVPFHHDDLGPAPGGRKGQRILIYTWRDFSHSKAGGAEVYLENVAREWVRSGREVTVFCSKVKGKPQREECDGVRVIRRGSMYSVYGEARKHWAEEGRGNFDLVIDSVNTRPFFTPTFVHDAEILAIFHQVAREVWFAEAIWPIAIVGRYLLEPRWLKQYRHVASATISASSRESLEEYGLQEVTVVPPGIPDVVMLEGPKESVPTVVFLGRLSPSKRPQHALDAFGHIRRQIPEARLWVVGDGPMRAKLERSAPDGVTFYGRVDDRKRDELVARAHVLLVPSIREGWGLVVTEAAHLGTPTVGYDVPGLKDSLAAHGGHAVAESPIALADRAAEHLRGTSPLVPRRGLEHLLPWSDVAQCLLDAAMHGVPEPQP
jgi:glycosyltransferase involved in cell wall biosynthesis/O-antigen/teichoic acid export membrane protein